MTPRSALHVCAALALIVGSALVSAQQPLLPSTPPKGFGASITPAFEGWFDNPDGTHTFLIGYFNRNTQAEPDVQIGPNNRFEPGSEDMGQPTHFLPGRRYGMFTYTVPKDFGPNQKFTWTLTVNGVTSKVPFYMSPDYNVAPLRASEQGATGYNTPPVLRFEERGRSFIGPLAHPGASLERVATVGVPMTLALWADDDAKFTNGPLTPLNSTRPPVELVLSKYRGPGAVTFGDKHAKMQTIQGGKADEPYSGKASTTATFDQAGDYVLHVTANDYSGNGGGGNVCCWTTATIKVAVRSAPVPTRTGQE